MAGQIVLQFSSCNDLLSDAIKAYQRGWCSHVDSVLADGTLLGARVAGGVAVRQPDYCRFERTLQVRLDTSDECAAAYYVAVTSQVGKPYDMKAIVGLVLNRNWRSTDRWFCSEICAWALEQACFFRHPIAVTNGSITPRDLLLLVSPFSADATLVG